MTDGSASIACGIYIAHPEPALLFLALSVLALAGVYFETGLI